MPRSGRLLIVVGLLLAMVSEAAAEAPAGVEERLEAAVRRLASQEFGLELRSEPLLREVAREHSLVQSAGAQVDAHEFLRQSQSEHGVLDPFPYVFYGSVSADELNQLETRLRRSLRGLSPGERRLYTHVAAGVVERRARRGLLRREHLFYVTLLLTQRAVTYSPLPRDVRPGERLLFAGEIHAPFREPEVLLTRPDGDTRVLDNLSLEPRQFRTYVSFDGGPGEYQLEVMGRYDMGPRVLALCSLYPRPEGEPSPYARLLDAARRGRLETRTAGGAQATARTEDEAEARLLELVNRDRARHGLHELEVDADLAAMARAHSADMRDHGFFAHVSPRTGRLVERAESAGIRFQRLAENIAVNRDVDAAEAALMRSPGHRMNILGADFTHVGLGVAFAQDDQGNRRTYVTQAFLLRPP